MESTLSITPSIISPIKCFPNLNLNGVSFNGSKFLTKMCAVSPNGSVSHGAKSGPAGDMHKRRGTLESLFCYDKPIPEEIIEKPVGVALTEKAIGQNPRCLDCQAKGAVLCATCAGSGLYVDSIMESQGIIVKVRCLGCGGSGNILWWSWSSRI